MAIKQVCSVYDSASRLYGQPFFVPAVAAAVRSVGDEANRADKDNALYQHPEDFSLFHLGSFDDSEGCFSPVGEGEFSPVLVARVKDLTIAKQ
ncbi:MAG: nonstructural protein [Microvirus sp.]|nr:MAG: nonstructural protein [Microvirus sp.]